MKTRSVLFALLPMLLLLQGWAMSSAATHRAHQQSRNANPYALPASLLKATALEYEGLASDLIFLRTIIFFGQTFERTERPRVQPLEWDWIRDSLSAAMDLDPWFADPYFMANSTLVWEGRRVLDGNLLLEKSTRFRTWDWLPPFMAGFNYYYFLTDNAKASELLMEAARRPGASPVIATLAARLASSSNQIDSAIAFLEEMYRQSTEDVSRTVIKERLTALLDIQALQRAVMLYRDRFGVLPADLQQLVKDGILVRIPEEPYGGHYLLGGNGTVTSSTDLGKHSE